MILTGNAIRKEVEAGSIKISPFNQNQINPNSYNYRLGLTLKVPSIDGDQVTVKFSQLKIPDEGYILEPGKMYLGSTYESIGSSKYAMSLIGRSSIGRYGLFLQVSANLGHTTSDHCWTLELVATLPIRVYAGIVIGHVSFCENIKVLWDQGPR